MAYPPPPTSLEPAYGAFAPTPLQRLVLRVVRRSFLRRGAFRPSVSRLLSLLRAGPIDAAFAGAPFRMHHAGSGAELAILLYPEYNRTELDFLRQAVPAGGVFVDVGANVGTYALTMARHVGANGRVVAVEPHPLALQRLAFNAASADATNVTIVPAAAGDGERETRIETHANVSSSRIGSGEGAIVPMRPLLGIVDDAGLDRIDGLKVDVEGYEDRVLLPFFRTAPPSLWPRAMVVEHVERERWAEDCVSGLMHAGYRAIGRTRSNTLLARDH